MKKKNVLNLIKYYSEKNDAGFKTEAYEIAKYFDSIGNDQLAQYIVALLSDANTFTPQITEESATFFKKVVLGHELLPLPVAIKDDIVGIINAIGHRVGVNKFLFQGPPGTGKTESVKQIARILNRDLFVVEFDTIIDSKLGQTSKNIATLFEEIHSLRNPEQVIILFDEIDAIAIDRINSHDLREMGRATSAVLKGLDGLNENVVLIATTNLYNAFDKALVRRFDSIIDFSQYTQEDLLDVSVAIANDYLNTFKFAGRNMRLFKKILQLLNPLPYPGELKNLIKSSLAFSNANDEFDYLKRLYKTITKHTPQDDLLLLQQKGFTLRELEILTGISKSQLGRDLKEES